MKKINIIGGGITGCFLSNFLKDSYDVHLYEKEDVLGGLCHTYKTLEGYKYQKTSQVIHTNDKWIIDLISNYIQLNEVIYDVSIDPLFDLRYYKFPFDNESINSMPWHWREAIELDLENAKGNTANNIKDLIINYYGETIFDKFFEGLLKKTYGKSSHSLDYVDWFRRYLRPVEYNGYYSEKYQYFPVDIGYNDLFNKLTDGVNVHYNSDIQYRDLDNDNIIILTTRPDLFFYGEEKLEYSTASFDIDTAVYDSRKSDSMIFPNYTPFLSINQFGKFYNGEKNVVVKQYPKGEDLVYPIPRKKNIKMYNSIVKEFNNVYFAGRFGSYNMLDIADIVRQTNQIAAQIKQRNN